MTMEQMLTAAVIAVCGALVYVYKRGEDKTEMRFNDLKDRVDACEEDRQRLWGEVRKLMGEAPRTDP